MKSRERESEEKTLLDLCAGPSSPVAVPDPQGLHVGPSLGVGVSPRSWLGLRTEEAAGHRFLGSPSLGRVVGAGLVWGEPAGQPCLLCLGRAVPPGQPCRPCGVGGSCPLGLGLLWDGEGARRAGAGHPFHTPRCCSRLGPRPQGVWGLLRSLPGEEGVGKAAEKPLGSLANWLSLICKSLLGRNQPHENAISTQSLFWPLSCFRQKQFTLPVIKQG